MFDLLPLSSFNVDKYFRLLHKVRSRISALQFQRNYLIKYYYKFLTIEEYTQIIHTSAKDFYLLKWLEKRLVNNSVICNTKFFYRGYLRFFNQFPLNTKDHSIKIFGFFVPKRLNLEKDLHVLQDNLRSCVDHLKPMYMDLIQKEEQNILIIKNVLEKMKKNCQLSRKAEIEARLMCEAILREKQGWFIVFNTLSVQGHKLGSVFNEHSTAWTDYVRSIHRAVGISLFGSWRSALQSLKRRSFNSSDNSIYMEDSTFHSYIACVERGGLHGRLHIHVLHFMKKLPNGCYDPNLHKQTDFTNREIHALKKYWKYGFSSPIAVRLGNNDAYSKLNWKWPQKFDPITKTFQPLKSGSTIKIVKYIVKYISKSYNNPNYKGGLSWRTKMSRDLGKTIPMMIISNPKFNLRTLKFVLSIKSRNVLKLKNYSLPIWTISRMAIRKMISKVYQKKKLILSRYWNSIITLKPRDNFLKQLKLMMKNPENHMYHISGNSKIMNLKGTAGSNMFQILSDLETFFFGHTKTSITINGNSREVRYV